MLMLMFGWQQRRRGCVRLVSPSPSFSVDGRSQTLGYFEQSQLHFLYHPLNPLKFFSLYQFIPFYCYTDSSFYTSNTSIYLTCLYVVAKSWATSAGSDTSALIATSIRPISMMVLPSHPAGQRWQSILSQLDPVIR